MSDKSILSIRVVSRRDLLLGAAGLAALAAFIPAAFAEEKVIATAAPPPAEPWKELLKGILGDATPASGKIAMDLPEIAENGNTVPFNFLVESRMTEADYVKKLHVISTANPLPQIATFEFTPQSGKAQVSSRMRLGRTQDVVALAEMSDGKFFMTTKTIKVTIGGCGG